MKKFYSVLLAAILAITFCAVTASAETAGVENQPGTVIYHAIDGVEVPMERGIAPRFRFFYNISCRMDQEKGLSVSTGTASVNTDYSNTLMVSIERSKNGGAWSQVKSWTIDDPNEDFLILERQYYLTKGYSYRAVSKIVVSTGTQTEVATCVSSTVYY